MEDTERAETNARIFNNMTRLDLLRWVIDAGGRDKLVGKYRPSKVSRKILITIALDIQNRKKPDFQVNFVPSEESGT